MKSPTTPGRRTLMRTALAISMLIPLLAARPLLAAEASPPKDHTLFIGLDLAVDKNGKYYTVSDATKENLTYVVGGKTEKARIDSTRNIRITKGVKVSTLTGSISDIQTDVVNRAAEAAQFEAMKTSMLLNDVAGDDVDRALGAMINTDLATSFDTSSTYDPIASQAFVDASRAAARANFAAGANNSLNAIDMANNLLVDKLNKSEGETIELSFNVSSSKPLDNAYIVIVADYAAPGKPNDIGRRISARKLAHIDSKPMKISLAEVAKVNGLEFKKFDFGLFADGQEVATNLSKNTTPITADDAYTFFCIDFLAAHKGETLPPTPMLMTSRSEFRALAPAHALDETIYAKVDKTGSNVSFSLDAAGNRKVPGDVATALGNVRFVPAIDKGVAVDGLAKIKLAQLVR